MRKRRNPYYGEPLSATTIALIAVGSALGIGGTATGIVGGKKKKEAQEKQRDAERKQQAQERKEAGAEATTRANQAEAKAISDEMALREKYHRMKVDQSDAKTAYVDQYRGQLGFTGDAYDQVLSNLYSAERAIALDTQKNALVREEQEIKEAQGTNYTQIALYSLLGVVGVGALVYAKKRKTN